MQELRPRFCKFRGGGGVMGNLETMVATPLASVWWRVSVECVYKCCFRAESEGSAVSFATETLALSWEVFSKVQDR